MRTSTTFGYMREALNSFISRIKRIYQAPRDILLLIIAVLITILMFSCGAQQFLIEEEPLEYPPAQQQQLI